MDAILECCCGLGIHKESIVACLLHGPLGEGLKPRSEIREFGTLLKDLIELRKWLDEHKCHYVAMESTGIFWQPVYAVLENALSDEMHLLVVNARHMKNVPGKKTGVKRQVQVLAHTSANVIQNSEGMLLRFSHASLMAGKSLRFRALNKPVRPNYFSPLFTFLAMIAQHLR